MAVPFTTSDLLPPLARRLAPVLDVVTGLSRLQRMYGLANHAGDFIAAALEILGIGVDVDQEALTRIPADGPLVIVVNHPHGAADGLAVAHIVRRVRRDVTLIGSDLLARIPELREHLIAVDAFNLGVGRNREAVRAAVEWAGEGHAVVVFPAGEVSHVRAEDGRVVDSGWREGAARIAAAANASVLPLFIEGQNSAIFVASGRVHPLLRTALLARELLRLRGSRIMVRVGRSVSSRRLTSLGDSATQTAYLRARCYALASGAAVSGPLRVVRRAARSATVPPPIERARLAAEVDALPARARLIETGAWRVFCAEAADIPNVLLEIGRLRELTFRAVGEGTGRDRDLDRYDRHYHHLFVWNTDHQAIAGAYRVAFMDRVVQSHGANALYTRSLFRYRLQLLRELGPSIELGRSFVAPEFQREYQPLLLLWRGIGRLVATEPRYRRLFGPVSISADYGRVTRQILARFLLANRYHAGLGALVRPRRPLATDALDAPDALVRATVACRLDNVDEIVRDLEAGQRGMPILLRQYLKLNAKLLGFSVDPAFGNVLDGLLVVDLLDVDRTLLTRYLGKDGAAAFLSCHGAVPDRLTGVLSWDIPHA